MLEKEGISVREGDYVIGAFVLEGIDSLNRIAAFREGYFTVQDESSQLAVEIARIHEGDLILDVCAAPGGAAGWDRAVQCLQRTGRRSSGHGPGRAELPLHPDLRRGHPPSCRSPDRCGGTVVRPQDP